MLQHTRLPEERVHAIVREAVGVEVEFVTQALPTDLIGINSRLMTEYVQFVADRLLVVLGYSKIYRASNPFPWMEMISLNTKENFFERKVGSYQKANVMAAPEKRAFRIDEDF